ncbi:Serine/threonine-protein kinase YPK1 [Phytophthora nicotianae]|nr:Serine/threonine-protein kinase YPK1 [Phytophthora nicotianae]
MLVARALLRRFQQQERTNVHKSADYRACDFESRLRDDQLLMFLGGAGGTGKSRVVDAIDAFCSGWHHDSFFVKAALTGKAATLIGGSTLASILVQLEHAIKGKKFEPLDLLVIDEVSMVSKAEWVKLDKLLRRYMQVDKRPVWRYLRRASGGFSADATRKVRPNLPRPHRQGNARHSRRRWIRALAQVHGGSNP